MSKINGHGGFLVANPLNSGVFFRVDNSEYELDYESMNDDVTDSGSNFVAEGLPCIVKLNSLTFTVAEDDQFYLTALGLEAGQRVNMFMRRGATAQFDSIENTIVKSVRNTNPQDKARRISITFEYGRLTRNVAPPGGFG